MNPADPPLGERSGPAPGVAVRGRAVGLSELLSALSYALDLTEGQPPGHTVRSCLIGMRLAEALELDPDQRSALYYSLLLKDTGCSANSAVTAEIFGTDEHQVKRAYKKVAWDKGLDSARYVFKNAAAGKPLTERLRHVLKVATVPGGAEGMIRTRCERGAAITRSLGFPELTAEAVRSLDEHWDGRGKPDGLRGEEIPLLARIGCLAQTVEVFAQEDGMAVALEVARQRRGGWFDPELVDRLLSTCADGSWWRRLYRADAAHLAREAEPPDRVREVDESGLDSVAQAFAEIIDAKSPFTYRHSSGVAEYARAISRRFDATPEEQRRLYRAGLLHDIGKLGISNRILDKPGKLTPEERTEIERHPVYTRQILERVTAFQEFAHMAALHHERLDGNGYPWKLGAADLDHPARILAVADVYEALTANRPYRAGMPPDQALGILRQGAGTAFDPDAVAALATLTNADPAAR